MDTLAYSLSVLSGLWNNKVKQNLSGVSYCGHCSEVGLPFAAEGVLRPPCADASRLYTSSELVSVIVQRDDRSDGVAPCLTVRHPKLILFFYQDSTAYIHTCESTVTWPGFYSSPFQRPPPLLAVVRPVDGGNSKVFFCVSWMKLMSAGETTAISKSRKTCPASRTCFGRRPRTEIVGQTAQMLWHLCCILQIFFLNSC